MIRDQGGKSTAKHEVSVKSLHFPGSVMAANNGKGCLTLRAADDILPGFNFLSLSARFAGLLSPPE